MMSWIVMLSGCLGFLAIAAGMNKHQRDFFGKPLSITATRMLTSGGWIVLVVGLITSVVIWGVSMGVSQWLGVNTFSALAVALLVSYCPRRLLRVAGVVTSLLLGCIVFR